MSTPMPLTNENANAVMETNEPTGLYDLSMFAEQNDLEQKSLYLGNTLQSTLDIKNLLALFSAEVDKLVPYDSIEYQHPGEGITIIIGEPKYHSCSYDLVLLEKSLGKVIITRSKKFSATENEHLEHLLCSLVYPLRNATLYKKAIDAAYRDPVTGTNNRTALDAALLREVELAHRHKTNLSMILLDIDFFKNVNDSYGHIAGDAVLRELGKCLIKQVRRSDMVFRYGGEEFVIILSNTKLEGAALLANRVRVQIESHRFKYDDLNIPITVSIGVAALGTKDHREQLITKADNALYQAKQTGRNRVIIAPEIQAKKAQPPGLNAHFALNR